MASKSINLGSDLRFDSIAAGKQHFDKVLKNTAIDAPVSTQEFDQLKRLYQEYCKKTNWPLNSAPLAFYPTYERGAGFTTRCFGIKFSDGSTGRFSLDKALSAVAN